MGETTNAYRLSPTPIVDVTIPPIMCPTKLNPYAYTFIIYEDLFWKDSDFCYIYYIQWKFKSNNKRTIIKNNRKNEGMTTIQQ